MYNSTFNQHVSFNPPLDDRSKSLEDVCKYLCTFYTNIYTSYTDYTVVTLITLLHCSYSFCYYT